MITSDHNSNGNQVKVKNGDTETIFAKITEKNLKLIFIICSDYQTAVQKLKC